MSPALVVVTYGDTIDIRQQNEFGVLSETLIAGMTPAKARDLGERLIQMANALQPPKIEPPSNLRSEVAAAINGRFLGPGSGAGLLAGIIRYRELTGSTLREAQEYCDKLRKELI